MPAAASSVAGRDRLAMLPDERLENRDFNARHRHDRGKGMRSVCRGVAQKRVKMR